MPPRMYVFNNLCSMVFVFPFALHGGDLE